MELKESRRGFRSLNDEAVAGDRGVLGGFVGSISSLVLATNAAVVDLFKRRGGFGPECRGWVPRQVSYEGQGNRATWRVGEQIFMAQESEGSRLTSG